MAAKSKVKPTPARAIAVPDGWTVKKQAHPELGEVWLITPPKAHGAAFTLAQHEMPRGTSDPWPVIHERIAGRIRDSEWKPTGR